MGREIRAFFERTMDLARRSIRHIEAHRDIYNLVFTLLTLVTAVGVYYQTKDQVEVTRDALRAQIAQWKSDSAAQDAKDKFLIASAESSNAIAIRTLALTERAAKIQTDPYISITPKAKSALVVSEDLQFDITFINSGKSPAYNFSAETFWMFGTKDSIKILLKNNPAKILNRNLILIPNDFFQSTVRIPAAKITDPFIEALRNKSYDLKIRIDFKFDTQWGEHKIFSNLLTYSIATNELLIIRD